MVSMTRIKKAKKPPYRDKIKAAFITQKRLAQMLGINEIEFSNKMNGYKDFTSDELYAIEVILKIQLLEIP